VLFRYNGNYVLHRIVRFDGNTVIIRGDALLSFEMVSPTDIIAILTAVQNIKTGKITNCKSLKWKYLSLKTVWSKQLKRKIKKLLVKRTTKY
ncbi:MAG: hypothetical protein J5605_04865, partial [Bacteroidales bacterium]|nr:hypothetical protein [Bacteroidales bacterium]